MALGLKSFGATTTPEPGNPVANLNLQLSQAIADLEVTQNEFERVLQEYAAAVNQEEAAYNSEMLNIIRLAQMESKKEPTDKVKSVMCEKACERERLNRRVLEFEKEALHSRIKVLSTKITAFQTKAKLLQGEMDLSGRYT